MARIPEETIKLILEKTNLPDLAGSYVKLRENGDDFSGCCPFHNEKTPSFHISASKNLYHCFGCGKGGSAIQFVMDAENLDFLSAVEFLAERAGVELGETNKDEELSAQRKKIIEINKKYAVKCYKDLVANKDALKYAEERGLTPQIIKHFCIGYADGSLDGLGADEQTLEVAGLASKKGNSKFQGRLIFPIIDVRKNVLAFGGRAIEKNTAKYINSPNTLAFNKSYNLFGLNLAKSSSAKSIILVEGYMDVVSLHKSGFTSAVASCGTAITEGQAKLIKRYKDNVIICYDQDDAGKEATKKAIDILRDAHLNVFVAVWDGAKDPDEFIQKFGKLAFEKVLKSAEDSNLFTYKSLADKILITLFSITIAFFV
ncbi:DNA primase, partial [Treponema sp. R6D11]